jgi:uracil-DNA glycosylase
MGKIDNKIKERMGEKWTILMKPFIESEEWNILYSNLTSISRAGKTIIPGPEVRYKSLQLCNPDRIKCVIVLSDPYTIVKEGKMLSNGIPLDCSNTKYMQSALWCWWEAVEKYYSPDCIDPNMWMKHDLSYLLEEEGVLLINSSLTTEEGKPGIHNSIWEPFMKHLFKILNENYRGLPISLMGTQAQKYEKEINPLIHHIHKCEAVEVAAKEGRSWKSNGVHKWINDIIEQNNGPQYKIRWYRRKDEELDKNNEKLQTWLGTNTAIGTVEGQDELKMPWD